MWLTEPSPAVIVRRLAVSLVLSIVVATPSSRLAHAADATWIEISPPTRVGHAAIYDPLRDRMLVFGGAQRSNPRADVWALSLGSGEWIKLDIPGAGPSPRLKHSVVYDPLRDRMLVFGGAGDDDYLNDVWALSLGNTPAWSLVPALGTPPIGRSGHSAIYDPRRDRMLVFGGGRPGVGNRNDVWELSLGGAPTWNEIIAAGTPPAPRSNHSAIYDPLRKRMVVFAGSHRNDVWALSLDAIPAWIEIQPPAPLPEPRDNHIAVHDPLRDRMIVTGGYISPFNAPDCWALPLAGDTYWQPLPVLFRIELAGIYDPVRDVVVVHGGYRNHGFGPLGDWVPDDGTARLVLAPNPGWEAIVPSSGLPPIWGHTAIHDPGAGRMVVYGGETTGCKEQCFSGGTFAYSLDDSPG
jgi:hypothetical protein